ncbi:MAG: 9-O-acetylesterase, partial [Actinobacteria bacterium]|nr:9-O-acetylesterase [Actinomycetota bacterium]
MKTLKVLVSLSFLFIYGAGCSFFAGPAKNLSLPTLFSDNMVFQRDMPLPVWGTANPGGKVKVEFANQSRTAIVGKDGKWRVDLDKMSAGGPFRLKVIGKKTKTFKNVMVGEVWICSGQSNMEMPLEGWGKVMNYKQEIANADYPNIRLFQVKHTTSLVPLDTINCSGWQECSPKTVPEFSAAAYFFGRHLYKDLNVPIGLIHTSWGGTIAEAWTSGEALKKLPDFVDAVKKIEAQATEKGDPIAKYKADLKKWNENIIKNDAGFSNGSPVWNKPDLKTAGWKTMKLPTLWEK